MARGGAREAARGAGSVFVAVLLGLLGAGPAQGQFGGDPDDRPRLRALEATALGALPPMALPMPASRNHNYLAVRAQSGFRIDRWGPDQHAFGGGVDLQWRGGSTFGLTAGYRKPDCDDGPACDGRPFFEARARLNLITGGPTIADILGDHSANSTLGTEIGFGWAPEALPGYDACTFDVGFPFSVAMLQTIRLTWFVMPAGSMSVDCGPGYEKDSDIILSTGIGLQQLGLRGLDVHIGFQQALRDGTGYQFGVSIMYVHLP